LVFTVIGRRAIPRTLLLLREGRLDNDLNIDTRTRCSALLAVGEKEVKTPPSPPGPETPRMFGSGGQPEPSLQSA
jgi:hypothetical protein